MPTTKKKPATAKVGRVRVPHQAVGVIRRAKGAKATASVRLPAQLIAEATAEAKLSGRTFAGQVEHWVRIGRALERMPGLTVALERQGAVHGAFDVEELTDNVRVIAALRGERSIEDFDAAERALFDEVLAMLGTSPKLAAGFEEIRAENARVRAASH